MVGAQGRRKRKRGSKAEASGSGNAHNVAQKAGKGKTRSMSRERKAVDRFVPGPQPNEKIREPKVFSIEQGPGTKLRDIPNVVFNLSKRKADENLQVLHTILYGRKSNVYSQKKNILQFSGFVWAEDEEKKRAKVKEQIDKCNKEQLLLLCELLDIPDMKATTKKKEVSAKLLEFLESPHATRSVVLAENVERDRKQKSIKETSQKAQGKGKVKVSRKPPPEPTEEQMRAVIIAWAKKNDLKNTTMRRLVRRLEYQFEMDLKHRKDEVWHVFARTCFEEDNQGGDADDSRGEDAARSGEDTGKKDSEGSGEDSGEEEDAEGSGEDSGEEEDAEGSGEDNAGEEEDTEGSGEDIAGEEEDAEGSGEDIAGEEADAEGSGEDIAGEEEDAEGSGEDIAGEEDDAEGSGEDAGEEDDAEGSGEDDTGEGEDAEGSDEDSVE